MISAYMIDSNLKSSMIRLFLEAFFRGMGAPLLTTGAMNSLYFGFYGSALDLMSSWRRRVNKRVHVQTHSH